MKRKKNSRIVLLRSKSLARNTFFSTITAGTYFFAGTLLIILLGRLLEVEEFGTVTLAIAVTTLLAILPNYGFNLLIIREISQGIISKSEVFWNVLLVKVILAILSVFILWIYLSLSSLADQPAVFIIFYFSIIVRSFTEFINAFQKAEENFHSESITIFIQNLVLLTLIIVAGTISDLSAVFVAILILIGRSAGFIIACFALFIDSKRQSNEIPELKVQLSSAWSLSKKAFPFAIQAALGVIYFQSDTVIIGELLGITSVGYYQASMRLVLALLRVPAILISAFYPRIAREMAVNDSEHHDMNISRTLIHILLFTGGVLSVSLLLLSEAIILLVYGEKMAPAIPILQILSLILIVRFVASGYGLIIISIHRQHFTVLVASVAVLLNVTLNMLLIPRFGLITSAWVNLVTNLLILICYAIFLKFVKATFFLSGLRSSVDLLLARSRSFVDAIVN